MSREDASTAPGTPGASACPACGALLPGEGHAGSGAAARCRSAYERVLADLYSVPALLGLRQLAVDAYAVQHPERPGRAADQSLGLHLMTLCLFAERGVDAARGPALHKHMVARRPQFGPLDPPANRGAVTVCDVPPGRDPQFAAALRSWADAAWTAWAPHHDVVRAWLREAGLADIDERPHPGALPRA